MYKIDNVIYLKYDDYYKALMEQLQYFEEEELAENFILDYSFENESDR